MEGGAVVPLHRATDARKKRTSVHRDKKEQHKLPPAPPGVTHRKETDFSAIPHQPS